MKQKYTPPLYWAIPEKIQTGGLRMLLKGTFVIYGYLMSDGKL